ncbi:MULTISPECIES: hypothetical protein [Caballeronia]|uniref:hypothetical protein n=1 Tax=Caballeronia TaxID=1827195 RepID=UPI00158B8EEE|nr:MULTISPECIES: hypothetical protein [Caballeronia]MCG7403201.1 hypothetical protein [Caballeronia zhejiangensis]MCI1044987.1 hypothetical protein [Caballeronia zhejiangensis]
MPKANITIRTMTAESLPEHDLITAPMQRHVAVLDARVAPDGINFVCEADVGALRRCAEHLASLSFVGGVSLQLCQAAASPGGSGT